MAIRIPTNYDATADIIADLEDMADSIQDELDLKVDKVQGKGLSTNDYTTEEKEKLEGLENYDDTEIQNALGNKVDKVTGKGLSTNDYSTEEKNKLAGVEAQANKTVVDVSLNETSTNPVQNKAIYAELAEKQEQIDRLVTENALQKDQIPNGTAEGTNVQITDSSNLPIEDGVIKGYTNQVQYEGRNLLSSSFEQGARSNENGTTLISSYQYVRTSNPIDVQPSTQYVVSLNGELKNGNVHFYNNDTFIRQTSTSSAFSTPNDCNKINIQFYNSTQITPASMGNAQLEQGSTAHDYEPYTGGQPSPNPDYKQDIHTVTGDCEVEVVTENLFNPANIIEQKNCSIENDKITITDNSGWGQSYVFCGEKLYAGQYTFSIYGNSDTVYFYIRGYKGDEIYQNLINGFYNYNTYYKASDTGSFSIVSYKKSFILPNDCDYYYVGFALGRNGTETVTVKVEKGTNDNPTYTPHAHQTFPISLGTIELCKIGSYKDRIFKNTRTLRSGRANPLFNPDLDEGDWYKHSEIGKFVFNGNNDELWNISSANTSGYNRFTSSVLYNLIKKPTVTSQIADICSNYFIKKSADNTYSRIDGISVGTNGNLYIYADILKEYTLEQFKTWLSTHNTTVYYPLATPTYTKITDTTLTAQLEAYCNSSTYRNVTNIITAGEDLPPIAGIVYKKDLTTLFNKLDSLEARLDLLEE